MMVLPSDKSMLSARRQERDAHGGLTAREIEKTVLAMLDEYGAQNIPVPPERIEKLNDTLGRLMDSDDDRVRVAAVRAQSAIMAYNLKRLDVADKLARGGNGPAQVVNKVYIGIDARQMEGGE